MIEQCVIDAPSRSNDRQRRWKPKNTIDSLGSAVFELATPMAYEQATADRVRRALKDEHGVVERRMMGGVCFMLRGNMCCGLSGARLMVRVGPDAYERMLAEPGVRPLEFAGRRPLGYVLVEPEHYRSAAALRKWVARGIAFASSLPPKRLASKKSKRRDVAQS